MGRRGRRDGGPAGLDLLPHCSLLIGAPPAPRPSVAMVTLLHWVLCRPPSFSAGWALSASLDRLQRQCLPTVIWLTHPSLFLSLITYTAGLTKPAHPSGEYQTQNKTKSQSCSGWPPSQAGTGLAWAGQLTMDTRDY